MPDRTATISYSDGTPPVTYPILSGTLGPEVIDIRSLYAKTGPVAGLQAPGTSPRPAPFGGTSTHVLKPEPARTDHHHQARPHERRRITTVTTMSTEAANFSWLLDNFVKSVPGVRHTLVVSADGLLMAMSDDLDRTSGDQLAAIVSGMSSLTRGAARQLRAGEVRQSIVEMDTLFLFTMSISDGSVLSVMADATCDVGLIGYEMALLVSRTESTLTPQLISEMRSRLPVAGEVRVGAGG